MRQLSFFLIIVVTVLLPTGAGCAQNRVEAPASRRFAFVIGNSEYKNPPDLPNPKIDAVRIASVLKSQVFDVSPLGIDLTADEFRTQLDRFLYQIPKERSTSILI